MPDDQPLTSYPKWDYQEYPKTLARDDFWGQGRRTIDGRRISEDEVAVLVAHLRALLDLHAGDVLLDLGCGNGALSARLFDECDAYVGADLSAYLIDVAHEFFERFPDFVFVNAEVTEFVESVEDPDRFTKALSYALIQYLTPEAVEHVLRTVWERFPRVDRFVLGNVPDRDRAAAFFRDGYSEEVLDRHESQIGRWWSTGALGALCERTGWTLEVARMSEDFFNAKYRFDAILTRG